MNKRDEVEQHRQSTMKKDKKSSKNESRFKFKFPRVFFRSSVQKHHSTNEQSSLTEQQTIPNFPSINEDQPSLNPKDMIVHRVVYDDQDDNKVALNYFQQKYKQILKPSLLFPKQYYNDILNKRYFNYSTIMNRHDLCLKTPNFSYSNRIYPPTNYKIPVPRPIVYREIEYSNDHITPPSASSVLVWNQCVRRLNTEYSLTINALEQAKECLEKVYLYRTNPVSKYPNLVTHGINEPKKTSNVTFCLPSPISEKPVLTKRILPSVTFSKPKLIKPVQLDTFVSFPNVEPISTIEEKDENLDSIADIIKKFNDLSSSLSSPQSIKQQSENNLQEETTYTVETFYTSTDNNENDLLSNPQQVVIVQEDTTEEQFNLAREKQHQEIEIINNTSSSSTTSPVLPNNNNESSTTSTPSKNNNKSISHIPKRVITTNASQLKQPTKSITSSSKLKPPSPSTSVNGTTTPIKITNGKTQQQSSSTVKKSPFINESQNRTEKKLDPTSYRVKSIVHQLNTTTSSRPIISSSITNKRPSRPISTNKTIVQRK